MQTRLLSRQRAPGAAPRPTPQKSSSPLRSAASAPLLPLAAPSVTEPTLEQGARDRWQVAVTQTLGQGSRGDTRLASFPSGPRGRGAASGRHSPGARRAVPPPPEPVVHRCGFRLWGHVSAGLAARAWTPAPEAGAARITELRMGIASRRWARSWGAGGGAHCVCASRPLASPPPRAHPGRLGLGSRGLTVDVEFAGLTVTVR